MKKLTYLLLLLLFSVTVYAQSDLENFVKKGIEHHDNGEFDEAIKAYKMALKIDSKSALANYEIALSYLSKKEYKKALKYTDKVLATDNEYAVAAYVIKGSALDIMGKTKASIKVFEKAIKTTKGSHLIYFNLAVNYYKINELDKAEKNVIEAIKLNPNHSSSHWMLANIHNMRGNKTQTLLASHYFLFLESNTQRSVKAYQILKQSFGGNVSQDSTKENHITLNLAFKEDSPFTAAELMLGMLQASNYTEEKKAKTPEQLFVENTKLLFAMLGEMSENEKHEGIWWDFYIPFYYDLSKTEHMETYCKYISQSVDKSASEWLVKNEQKFKEFDIWLKVH